MTEHPAPEAPLGRLVRDGEHCVLRYERSLRHAPEVVWAAITESEHLAAWMPVDIVGDRRAGATVRFPFWPAVIERFGIADADEYVDGTILEFDPPRSFAFDWGGDVIRFELAAVDDGTLLVLTARLGPAPVEPWQAAAGWHLCLGFLTDHLDTGRVAGVATGDPTPLEAVYRDELAEA